MSDIRLADPTPVQLLAEDGTLTEHPIFSKYIEDLDEEILRELYRHMVLERRFDTEATSLQRQGLLALWVPALGQEAAQIGAIAALEPTDRVFPTYREHAMALYRGITPEELMGTFRATRHTGWDPHAYNFNAYSVVLASQVMHAAGWGMGIKQDVATGTLAEGRPENELVLACLGDGATSQGTPMNPWCSQVPTSCRCSTSSKTITGPSQCLRRPSRGCHWRIAPLDTGLKVCG